MYPRFFRAISPLYVTSENQHFRNVSALLSTSHLRHSHHGATNNYLPNVPPLTKLHSPEHMAEARTWVENFKQVPTLKGAGGVDISFSKISGSGGLDQHINKANLKATLHCSVNAPWIPVWAREYLEKNPHYVASSHSILLTSTVYELQSQNADDCFSKLHSIIIDASSAPIKKTPSPEQKKKVEELVKLEKARRRAEKDHHSDVKKGRRGDNNGDDDWF